MRSQSSKCKNIQVGSKSSRKLRGKHHLSRFASGAGVCFLATSALFGEAITGNITENKTLNDATTWTVVDGGNYEVSGVISGAGTLTKDGAGTLNFIGNNTFSGGINITGGTLKASLTLPTGIRTDTYKPLGTGMVTIGENGTLVWNVTQGTKVDQNDTVLTNTITGTGTLRMEMGKTHGNTMFALNSKLSDFTGTLELAGNTRVEWGSGTNAEFNKISTVRIESGSEFWIGHEGTFESDFILNGTGAGAGDDPSERGAFRIHAASTFNGTITLESDSTICAESGKYNVTFQNDVNLNEHVLTLNQTLGGTSVRNYVFSGDVSTGTFLYRNNPNIAFTIATSEDVNFAKDQMISAAIHQNNTTNKIVVSPTEGKTIHMDGVISGNGGIHKTGDGTVILGALNTFAGGLVIDAGTVELKNDMDGESTTVTAKQYSAGTGPITINENGTFIWYNQFNNDTNVDNKIIGSGKLVLSAKHDNKVNKTNQIVGNMDEFTGTLELRDEARLVDPSLGGTTKIIVQSGAQFWTKGETVNAELHCTVTVPAQVVTVLLVVRLRLLAERLTEILRLAPTR